MQEIGKELRQAREEKNLTLEEISTRTMISKKYLRALEEGEFQAFSGEVYLKGALRKYAEELKLDPEPLLNRYSPQKQKDTAENEQNNTEKQQAKPVRITSGKKRLNIGRLVMVLLIVILLVAGIRAIGTIISTEEVVTDPPLVTEPDDNLPPPDDLVEEEPELPHVRIVRDSDQSRVLFHVFNAELVTAEMSFSELCWTKVETDNESSLEQTFSAGQSHAVTANDLIRIRIGNPPAVKLMINGEEVQLPDKINAYTFEITNAGME